MTLDESPLLQVLPILSLPPFPDSFATFLFTDTDYSIIQEFPSSSTTKSILIETRSGQQFILKSNTSETKLSPRFLTQIASQLSIRFFFLDPIQKVKLTSPHGFLFQNYGTFSTLRDSPQIPNGTTQTLIAAFVAYAMARLEVNQIIHGALHSGNIYLTQDWLPIVTD